MRRFATGLALTALLALAACAESTSSGEARTKNAALETTTSSTPMDATTSPDATPTSLPAVTTSTGQSVTPSEASTTLPPPSTTPTTTTTVKPTSTTINRFACLVTAIRTGGSGSTIPMRVTTCRPMKSLVISYWNRGDRLTWYVTDFIPNSSTRDFDWFMRIQRVAGFAGVLPDEVELRPTFTDGSELPPVRLAISTTLQSASVLPPAPTTIAPGPTTAIAPRPTTTTALPTTTVTLPKPTTTMAIATTLPATTTTASAKPASVNPLDCEITVIRTGGSGSSIPLSVTACRPMRFLQISYWLGNTRLTYSLLENVPNSTSISFDGFARLARFPGRQNDLPDSVSLEPRFSDGSAMAPVRLPISTTLQSTSVRLTPATTTLPPTTTTLPPTTTTPTTTLPTSCTITLKGSILRACRPIARFAIEWWDDSVKVVNGYSSGPKVSPASYIEIVPVWTSVAPTRGFVKLRLDNGAEPAPFFVPISKSADQKFNVEFTKGPSPTTTTLVPPGCDLRVRYGAITPNCGKIMSYTYQWHDGVNTISGTMSANTPNFGLETVYLGALRPPNAATYAVVKLTFTDGRTAREVLVPLTQDTKIIRAIYR